MTLILQTELAATTNNNALINDVKFNQIFPISIDTEFVVKKVKLADVKDINNTLPQTASLVFAREMTTTVQVTGTKLEDLWDRLYVSGYKLNGEEVKENAVPIVGDGKQKVMTIEMLVGDLNTITQEQLIALQKAFIPTQKVTMAALLHSDTFLEIANQEISELDTVNIDEHILRWKQLALADDNANQDDDDDDETMLDADTILGINNNDQWWDNLVADNGKVLTLARLIVDDDEKHVFALLFARSVRFIVDSPWKIFGPWPAIIKNVETDLVNQNFNIPETILNIINEDNNIAAFTVNIHLGIIPTAAWKRHTWFSAGDLRILKFLPLVTVDQQEKFTAIPSTFNFGDSVEIWEDRRCPAKFRSYLSSVALIGIYRNQIRDGNANICNEFGMARSLIVQMGLWRDFDNNEVVRFPNARLLGVIPSVEFDNIHRIILKKDIRLGLGMAVLISFLQSGHHVGANHFINIAGRISRALDAENGFDEDFIRTIYGSTCYFGWHVASIRLLLAYAVNEHKNGELSRAIALRITFWGPGINKYKQHNLYMESLQEGMFFLYTKNEKTYESWNRSFNVLKNSYYYYLPYSKYLFGKSQALGYSIENDLNVCGAYGAAIGDIAPTSTLRRSIAWTTWVNQAASSSIIKPMAVQAWGAAIRLGYVTNVTKRVTLSLTSTTNQS